jgi:hypothetical protein
VELKSEDLQPLTRHLLMRASSTTYSGDYR